MRSETLDEEEVRLFNRLAEDWWDEEGEMSFLHSMSEIRMTYIKNIIFEHFVIQSEYPKSLEGIRVLDVGCGGGIASEPMARMGAKVTGIDQSVELINVAKKHSQIMNLKIKYLNKTIESIASSHEKYDVVVALELLEHVNNFPIFCKLLSECVEFKGLIILSTINRTVLAKLLVINLAENILKKMPKGTHNFKKFIKPNELSNSFKSFGFKIRHLKGLTWLPSNRWILTDNTSVNYICTFVKS